MSIPSLLSSPQLGNAVAPRAKATPHNSQARSGIQLELKPLRHLTN